MLYQLAHDGPTVQRDLVKALQVERATLSAIIAVLVSKGLVEQVPDPVDQRQKLLRMTAAGAKLWKAPPDLAVIHDVAFKGVNAADIAAAVRVLENPWHLHVDSSLARSLGFQPTVRTVYQAVQEKLM